MFATGVEEDNDQVVVCATELLSYNQVQRSPSTAHYFDVTSPLIGQCAANCSVEERNLIRELVIPRAIAFI